MFKTGAQEEHTCTHMIQLKQIFLFLGENCPWHDEYHAKKQHFCTGRVVVFAGRSTLRILWGEPKVKYGVRCPDFIWAPYTQLYALAETQQNPPPPAFGLIYQGRYWLAKNDISLWSLRRTILASFVVKL
jgi:hypothetical protein